MKRNLLVKLCNDYVGLYIWKDDKYLEDIFIYGFNKRRGCGRVGERNYR